ncbi:MAG TPA: winged helix-turn-helix domain-containing protein, partial [Burkholderiaceae bacterium]|nr:winged helix-turn-helix domain-containing protein [Burkholderiaceae bacterium]
LLLTLLQHRDRPVTRDELLDWLWPGEDASLASLASAIVKVRRAIGDSAEAPIIRTVHKLGYRFVADVAEELPVAETPAPAGSPPGQAMTIALLPVQNLSDDPALDWVSSGLAALVGAELAEAEHLRPLPMAVVYAALRQGVDMGDREQWVRVVQEFTGAQGIVHASLRREPAGLSLDYSLQCLDRSRAEPTSLMTGGRLTADEPIRLGRMLARRLMAQLRRDVPVSDAAGAPRPGMDGPEWGSDEPSDPWAMEVLAHALQAVAAQKWERAVNQLTVVLDIEPHHVRAQLELLQAQAHLHVAQGRHGAALDLWRQAESLATRAGHRRFALRANSRCAQVAVLCGLWNEALHRAQEVMAFAQSLSDPSEACLRANEVCMVFWLTDQPMPELPFALGTAPPPTLAENARAAWWAVKGHYAARGADHELAAACFAEGARLFAQQGAVHGQQILQLRCAHALIESGQLAQVEPVLQEVDLAGENTFPFMRRMVTVFRARLAYARGRCKDALALLQPMVDEPAFDYPHAYACILCARWHAQAGHLDEACKVLVAIEGSRFQRHLSVRAVLRAVGQVS